MWSLQILITSSKQFQGFFQILMSILSTILYNKMFWLRIFGSFTIFAVLPVNLRIFILLKDFHHIACKSPGSIRVQLWKECEISNLLCFMDSIIIRPRLIYALSQKGGLTFKNVCWLCESLSEGCLEVLKIRCFNISI